MIHNEIDQRLIASLTRLTAHLDETVGEAEPATAGFARLSRASRALERAGELLDRAVERLSQLLGRGPVPGPEADPVDRRPAAATPTSAPRGRAL